MTYPQDPNQSWNAPSAGGYTGGGELVSADDRNWALGAHLASIVSAWFALGLIAPLVVLLVRGNQSAFVRRHAVESLNFQIFAAVLGVISTILIIVGIGVLMLIVLGVYYLAAVIMGTIAASQGREYRYPVTVRLIR